MASRKEQKEQARTARLAAAEAERASAVRRRRGWILAGIVLSAAVVIAVVIVVSGGGGGSGLLPKRQATRTYRQVEGLLAGIPQSGARLGDPGAKVTMTYVGDLECPYCSVFAQGALSQFIPRFVRSGKVKLVYRSLCTASCGVNASRFVPQQVAAYSAGRQRLFWQYAELFYREQQDESQPYVTEQYLRGLARQIPNLSFKQWLTDRGDPALTSQVQEDQTFVIRSGLPQQTPEIRMTGPKGSVNLPAEAEPTLSWLSSAVRTVS